MNCFYLAIVKEISMLLSHKLLNGFVSKIVANRNEFTKDEETCDTSSSEDVSFHVVVEVSGCEAG